MRLSLAPPALVFTTLAILLAGCSSSSQPAAPSAQTATQPAAAPDIVTAKTAFWPMYKEAHSWANDVVVIRLTAKPVPGFQNHAGKAALWEAVFASPSLKTYRIFTNSIASVPPNIFKGVTAGLALSWAGATRDAMPIDLSLFTVDSDAAFTAASADAADWLKKNPGKDLAALELGDTWKFPGPVWYVMWGTKTSGYATFIDASTGRVLKRR
jgi:hypothetical protein